MTRRAMRQLILRALLTLKRGRIRKARKLLKKAIIHHTYSRP